MADTGSEIAESGTRNATGIASRLLERELIIRIADLTSRVSNAIQTDEPPADIEIGVRCPEGDLDARAEEILEALERGKTHVSCAIDDASSTIILGASPSHGEAMLRALERLSANGRSGFSFDDVTNVGTLEAVVGRRALGTARTNEHAKPAVERGGAEPVESVSLTFDNHPENPSLDASKAAAYSRRMAELGFDTSHRPIDIARRNAEGELERTHAHVVGVSYLARERDSFLDASAVAIHELGIPTRKDPFASDRNALEATIGRLLESAEERREAFARNRGLVTNTPAITNTQNAMRQATQSEKAREETSTAEASERELTAEEYASMPPREQAKVDPARIPDKAFGGYRAADVAREQTEAAAAMREHATPARTQPEIGGR